MKDFDELRRAAVVAAEDRTFKIAGKVFRIKAFVAADDKVALDMVLLHNREVTAEQIVAALDDYITKNLEDGQAKDWRAVRNSALPEPIQVGDLYDIANFIDEVATGRPTERPSDSGNMPAATGTESMAESPSQEAISVA